MAKPQKTVLITGASSGIGKATALYLDKAGYRVFAGVRKSKDGDALKAEASPNLRPVELDVTVEASITAAREWIIRETDQHGLFGLVNNAGFALAGPLEFQPVNDLRQQLEVNLVGVMAVTQAFIPLLRQARGRVINIGSISGISAMPFQGTYCATKFGLEALSDALRVELRPWNVHVSIIQPGDIQTPAWKKSLEAADQMLAAWPPQAFDLYGPVAEMMRKMAQEPRGIPPEAVAQEVFKLLRVRSPKARVLVGTDAYFLALIERLPTPPRDLSGRFLLRSGPHNLTASQHNKSIR